MGVGIIGSPVRDMATATAMAFSMLTASSHQSPDRGIRYVYSDSDGDFVRAYANDSLHNRLRFVEALQGTEFCYGEADIQAFLAYKPTSAIVVENI